MISKRGSDTPLRTANGAKKQWDGRTSRALRRVYDGAHPPSLFIAKAQTLHRELRLGGPPFDPWEIANRLNIRIKEESMGLVGYLERRPDDTFAIYLRREATLPRKRFTICHEIANSFFSISSQMEGNSAKSIKTIPRKKGSVTLPPPRS